MAIQISSGQIKSANIITSLLAAEAVTAAKVAKTGTWDFSSATLRAGTPTADTDVANKTYVDALISGLHWKDSARVKTTGAISGTYNNGSSGVGATLTNGSNGAIQIDGVNLTANDRVLVANQPNSDKEQNGIYFVSTVGDGSNPFVLTRSADADSPALISNAALFVTEGSTSSDSAYVQTGDAISAIGTSDISFVQFSGGGQLVAGAGILKSGNTLSIRLASDAGLETSSDELRVKLDGGSLARAAGGLKVADNGIGTAQIASSAVTANELAANSVGTSELASNSVTSAKLADGAVSTSAKLADGIVVQAKIANNAVDGARLADGAVSATKLAASVAGDALGLNGGNNALEVKVDDSSIEINSDALRVKASGITDGMLANNAVQESKIANNAVTADKLNANAVTSAKIANNAVNASKLNADVAGDGLGLNAGTNALEVKVDDATIETNGDSLRIKNLGVSSAKIADGAIGTPKLANAAVDSSKIADGAINTHQKLGSGVVTTAKLDSAAVTSAKIANNAVGSAAFAFVPKTEFFSGNGSAATFDLAAALDAAYFDVVKVFRNGLRMKKVASSPSGQDEYIVDNGGAGSVGRISFGSAPDSGDSILVDSWQ